MKEELVTILKSALLEVAKKLLETYTCCEDMVKYEKDINDIEWAFETLENVIKVLTSKDKDVII